MHSVFTNLVTNNNNKTNKLEYLISFLSLNFLADIYIVLHISLLLIVIVDDYLDDAQVFVELRGLAKKLAIVIKLHMQKAVKNMKILYFPLTPSTFILVCQSNC